MEADADHSGPIVTQALPNTKVVEARGKLNVFLRVLGGRPDGYHELETLILPISLADRLEIHAYAGPGEFRTLSLSLEISGERSVVRAVPSDETNLVLRAASALSQRAGVTGFADVLLEKNVPPAAGLGGGSADAAATLRALDELWGCALGLEALLEVAATVGSDVPALVLDQPALVRGRGDLVEPASVANLRWTLATFPFGVSTADAFGWWDEDGGPTGPDPAPVLEAASSGDAERLATLLFNDLEGPVTRRHPEIREAKDQLLSGGAAGVVMCGSGPTLAVLRTGDGQPHVDGGIEVES